MGPPQHDTVMGPPPVPAQVAQSGSQQKAKDADFAEKYRRLKRKYFELEEKHKETAIQLRSSGERNVKWRAERALLLDRITELEVNPHANPGSQAAALPFSAFPRSLMNDRTQKVFIANLHQAIEELEREDPEIDPHILSRHIGPAARRQQELQERERQEEDAREAKRSSRKARGPQKGKDMGAPLTFAPAPIPGQSPSGPHGNPTASPPILVSSTGTRLRLKPPAPPGGEVSSASLPHPGAQLSGGSQHIRHRSESLSPVLSPQDDYMPGVHHGPMSPSYQHGAPPSQAHMQTTMRTSSTRPSEAQRQTKPKRLKAHTVITKSFSIPMVPRDKHRRPILPLNVGIMTVINLGSVCMREHFHTERYIFPVGYEVTRRYFSTIDPNQEVVYHCKILDGGDGPKFQITASDLTDKPIFAGTATGAWSVIVRAANHIRNRAHSNSVSGPDFFGLGQNTIKHLIQELAGADKLKDYVWQHFVEGGPLGGRHAAVIPALPDEHDDPALGNGALNGENGHGGYLNERGEPEPEPIPVPAVSVRSSSSRSRGGADLMIIEDPSLRARNAPPPQTNAPMKNITFHQEYPNAPPENGPRTRRGSRASNAGYDDYANPPPGGTPMRVDSPTHSRTASRSPIMHRERDRDDHFSPPQHHLPPGHVASPHGHRSPYGSHGVPAGPGSGMSNGGEPVGYRQGTPPPPVPATFASIMHAYPAPPIASSPPLSEASVSQEYAYANGNGRRNGHPGER
ncbi:uncharacterized protein TRAVEDRAFT_147049 [Trametes versicolor FP-101664 SS1]|uniref:uncharacterized protein n=1 Tax=Trametes versicolor (strain FP-101664) TaxID=717944 RepID=UPI0004622115|nr:uncharacterized protein TRAVEDRAFT_147049 [Trametes versicolor FP-101664 SS1]EIW59162.1 hypothetical protein TRAVEDRAFT_147049 [Trametes versicolor FP-101664 SS1]